MPDATQRSRVLYIVTRSLAADAPLLISGTNPGDEISVILTTPAVVLPNTAGHRVSMLQVSPTADQSPVPYPTVTCTEMLRMVFEADRVIVL